MKTHLRTLTVTRNPERSESLLVTQQKVAVWTAVFTAVGVLAESVGAWVDLFNKGGGSR
ncbi:MAG TPA: hypothetical protein PK379_09710 [Candidatus Hydrogenedentes bacterium]|nr:hypothetical protein [Candidatus Hydrogenedentota bacterium]HOK90291.1 hypothetical protein [Candidatus Hydrogenedentota bacterium]HOV61444.1 hypothetical protein [Candidatus Hydrogenedentota bacterium]